ncbi:hypothetical protein AWJ20_2935 [Sugiyamaella lignohabitans]|uniref:Uncharacterized protein n=1 Tax=Sugiyamaella lignohabitans TaxID=796027 RepID=A0A167FHM5_9ASCO|nr:uncharacterized protein AWJ20_2935 [Sugiyamaella lignohabitans]ANB15308.1 hypothetical protein AWJ20_2935 [Sugiyamaella lignohabitans]
MVLHNSKWDKKATRKHQKKHNEGGKKQGIGARFGGETTGGHSSSAEVESGEPNSKQDKVTSHFPSLGEDVAADSKGGLSNNSYNSDSDSSEDSTTEENGKWKPRRSKLQSNVWRYQKKSPEDQLNELLAESAALAAAEGEDNSVAQSALKIKIEEIRNLQASQESNLDFFPSEEVDDEYDQEYHDLMREAALKANSKVSGDDNAWYKSHVQIHDDPEEFERLQNQIDHSKLINDIKKRFGSRKKNTTMTETKEDDIDSFLGEVDALQVNSDKSGDESYISDDIEYNLSDNDLGDENDENENDSGLRESNSLDKRKEEYLDFLLS